MPQSFLGAPQTGQASTGCKLCKSRFYLGSYRRSWRPARSLYRWSTERSLEKKRDVLSDNLEPVEITAEINRERASWQSTAPRAETSGFVSDRARNGVAGTSGKGSASSREAAGGESSDSSNRKPDEDFGWTGYDETGWGTALDGGDWDWNGQYGQSTSTNGAQGNDIFTGDGDQAPFQDQEVYSGEDPGADDGSGSSLPDVTLFSAAEVEQVLPVAPAPAQAKYVSGDSTANFQRFALAVAVSLLTSKFSLVAATAFSFPFWYPFVGAYLRNSKVRQRYAGLWHAFVLEIVINGGYEARRNRPDGLKQDPFVEVLVGDSSGARTRLRVPYDRSYERVKVGDSAEVIVLSRNPSFQYFQALKEAYLPETGLWLSKYPYVDKDAFLDLSLMIHRERTANAGVEPAAA